MIRRVAGEFVALDETVAKPESAAKMNLIHQFLQELNSCFHFTLYEPLQNQMLFRLIEQMHANVDRYIRVYYSEPEYHAVSKKQHFELLKACREHDVDLACSILNEHICSTKALLEPRIKE